MKAGPGLEFCLLAGVKRSRGCLPGGSAPTPAPWDQLPCGHGRTDPRHGPWRCRSCTPEAAPVLLPPTFYELISSPVPCQ